MPIELTTYHFELPSDWRMRADPFDEVAIVVDPDTVPEVIVSSPARWMTRLEDGALLPRMNVSLLPVEAGGRIKVWSPTIPAL